MRARRMLLRLCRKSKPGNRYIGDCGYRQRDDFRDYGHRWAGDAMEGAVASALCKRFRALNRLGLEPDDRFFQVRARPWAHQETLGVRSFRY
jgi:hypothetical protein